MNSVFCFFPQEKPTKCFQNPGLVNQFSAIARGQLNWTGPIANGSEKRACFGARLLTLDVACMSIRSFEKGLAGGGWRATVPKTQDKKGPPELCSPTHKGAQ